MVGGQDHIRRGLRLEHIADGGRWRSHSSDFLFINNYYVVRGVKGDCRNTELQAGLVVWRHVSTGYVYICACDVWDELNILFSIFLFGHSEY